MLTFNPDSHDAVIFDCDGTLVDSMPLHHSAWQTAFERYGAPFRFTWDRFMRRAGMTIEQTVDELNREFGCQLPVAEVAAAQRAEYRRLSDGIRPIPHVVAFARSVSTNHPVAVASGSTRASVEDALMKISAMGLFATIVTPSDVERGKPAPDMFLLVATRLSVPAHRCLVVEDGELGLLAARQARMDAYCVDRGGGVKWLPVHQ